MNGLQQGVLLFGATLLMACPKEEATKSKDVTTVTVTPPSSSARSSAPITAPPSATFPAPPATGPTGGVYEGAKEGELCGGIGGIMCKNGLHCVMVGPTYPDQAGTCRK